MKRKLRQGTKAIIALVLSLVVIGATDTDAANRMITESTFDPELMRIDEFEYLGTPVQSDLTLIGHDGKEFTLADISDIPTILVFSYYSCDGFCPAFNADLRNVLEQVVALNRVKPGVDFRVLTVSFDKNDDAESAQFFNSGLNLPEALVGNWITARLKDTEEVKPFTESLGYKFFWSPADHQFFHPNALYFISSEGRVVRILHSAKTDASDMELAILDSKFNRMKPTEIVNMAVSLCYSYNFKDGKYGLNYPLFIAFGSLFTGITAFAFAARVSRKKVTLQKGKGEKV